MQILHCCKNNSIVQSEVQWPAFTPLIVWASLIEFVPVEEYYRTVLCKLRKAGDNWITESIKCNAPLRSSSPNFHVLQESSNITGKSSLCLNTSSDRELANKPSDYIFGLLYSSSKFLPSNKLKLCLIATATILGESKRLLKGLLTLENLLLLTSGL